MPHVPPNRKLSYYLNEEQCEKEIINVMGWLGLRVMTTHRCEKFLCDIDLPDGRVIRVITTCPLSPVGGTGSDTE